MFAARDIYTGTKPYNKYIFRVNNTPLAVVVSFENSTQFFFQSIHRIVAPIARHAHMPGTARPGTLTACKRWMNQAIAKPKDTKKKAANNFKPRRYVFTILTDVF